MQTTTDCLERLQSGAESEQLQTSLVQMLHTVKELRKSASPDPVAIYENSLIEDGQLDSLCPVFCPLRAHLVGKQRFAVYHLLNPQ